MIKYRDLLCERYDSEIGFVVGCGLDCFFRDISFVEIEVVVVFYIRNKIEINLFVVGGRW